MRVTRHAVVLGPIPLGRHSAARTRIEAIASAFEHAGWATELVGELLDDTPASVRRWVAPASWVRLATRVGVAGDIQPRQGLVALNRARLLPPSSLLVVSVPPFSLLALTAAHRGPTIVDYRDILSFASRRTAIGQLLSPLERTLVRRCAAGVSLAGSTRLVNQVTSRVGLPVDRVCHLPNGVCRGDLEGSAARRANHSEPIRLVYAGELYGYADFRPISHVVADLPAGTAELHVVTPTHPSTLRRYIGSDDRNVIVHAPMARRDLYRFLRTCDFGLIALTREYPYLDSVPAKYYDYLAAGIDIIYVGPYRPALLDEPGSERVRVVSAGMDQLRIALLEERATVHERRDRPLRPLLVDRDESAIALVRLAERLTRSVPD